MEASQALTTVIQDRYHYYPKEQRDTLAAKILKLDAADIRPNFWLIEQLNSCIPDQEAESLYSLARSA